MKKHFTIFPALIIALALCACTSTNNAPRTTTPTKVNKTTQDPVETEHQHDYREEITKEASCTAVGTMTFTCTCGDTYTAEINLLDHNFSNATCIDPKTCSVCGQTEGTVASHSWNDATCTKPKTCSTCGKTEGTVIDHSYSYGKCVVCGTKQIYSLTTLQEIKDDLDFTMERIVDAEDYVAQANEASYSSIKNMYFTTAKSCISLLPSHVSLMALVYPDIPLPNGYSLNTLLNSTETYLSYANNTSYMSSFETYLSTAKEYTQYMLDGINQLIAEQS